MEVIATKLKDSYQRHKKDIKLYKDYIPPDATEVKDANKINQETFDLMEKIKQFFFKDLVQNQKLLALFGPFGSGKSFFCRYLENYLWEQFDVLGQLDSPIPLYVQLYPNGNWQTQLVEDTLRLKGLTEQEIVIVKEKGSLFLIFDGYDELMSFENLFVTNGLYNWKRINVLITCRSSYVSNLSYSSYANLFLASILTKSDTLSRNLKNSPSLFSIFAPYSPLVSVVPFSNFLALTLTPFSEQKISNYFLKCFGNEFQKDLSLQFKQYQNIQSYFHNPFFLKMFLNVLPMITNIDPTTITYFDIWDYYTKKLFQEKFQTLQGSLNKTLEEAQKDYESLSQELGIWMFFQDTYVMGPKDSLYQYFFGTKSNESRKIGASLSPFKPSKGKGYKFIHKSLRDYFAAKYLMFELLDDKRKTPILPDQTIDNTYDFNKKIFVNEELFLTLLADQVKKNKKFEEKLFGIIEDSKLDKTVQPAAANAISILNKAKVSFVGKDFRGITIIGADLSNSNLERTNFRFANLSRVNFIGSRFLETKLDYSILHKAHLFESFEKSQQKKLPFLLQRTKDNESLKSISLPDILQKPKQDSPANTPPKENFFDKISPLDNIRSALQRFKVYDENYDSLAYFNKKSKEKEEEEQILEKQMSLDSLELNRRKEKSSESSSSSDSDDDETFFPVNVQLLIQNQSQNPNSKQNDSPVEDQQPRISFADFLSKMEMISSNGISASRIIRSLVKAKSLAHEFFVSSEVTAKVDLSIPFQIKSELNYFDISTAFSLSRLCVLTYQNEKDIENVSKKMWDFEKVTILDTPHNSLRSVILKKDNNLVIAFRGTDNIFNVMSNFEAAKASTPLLQGRVHEGFLSCITRIWESLKAKILEFNPNENSTIWLTGHSLGGVLATLCAASLVEQKLFSGKQVRLYTIGQPRCGDATFQTNFEKEIPLAFPIFKKGDPIPTVPPNYWPFSYQHISTFKFIDQVYLSLDENAKELDLKKEFLKQREEDPTNQDDDPDFPSIEEQQLKEERIRKEIKEESQLVQQIGFGDHSSINYCRSLRALLQKERDPSRRVTTVTSLTK